MRIRLLPGSNSPGQMWAHDEVLWGIPRRHGYSDIDDPRAHSGIAQHAFPLGHNERAICGNEPPKRPTWINPVPHAQLAVPSPIYNPRCQDCQRLLVGRPGLDRRTRDLFGSVAIPIEVDPLAAPISLEAIEPLPPPETIGVEAIQPPRRKSSRRSVRRGGTTTVEPGEPIVEIHALEATAGAGIVASVVDGPDGVRVASVTVHDGGRATIELNQVSTSPIRVAWFIVSNIAPEASGVQQQVG
jgi:hypothetical protein